MRTAYLTPALLVLFLIVAGAWLVLRPSGDAAPPATEAVAPPAATPGAVAPNASASGIPDFGKTPFLPTHEPAPTFVPDGGNVAPSFHVEIEDLKRRLEASPEDTATLLRLARLTQDAHQTEEAIGYYRRYLAIEPESRQAWLDLTQSLGRLGQWDDAREAAEALLRYFPDDPAGLYNLGAIHANTGRTAEARALWQQVVAQEADPEMQAMAESALQRLGSPHP